MNPWDGPLAAILDAVRVLSPAQFTLADASFGVSGGAPALAAAYAPRADPTARAPAPGPGGGTTAPLVAELTNILYNHCYCRPFAGRIAAEPPGPPRFDRQFVESLSAANATRERWEPGWKIAQVQPTNQVVAERPGQRRTLWGGEYISEDGPASAPRVGAAIRVYRARESRSLQPGLYHAFGETAAESSSSVGTVRLYWNLRPAGAPEVLRALTPRLNLYSVPFRLKCVASADLCDRADGGVLYFPKEYFRTVGELVREAYPRLRRLLKDDVPLFTRRLAPGLAAAEDPANGDSFGQHRCRLVAEAIWRGFERGEQSVEVRRREFLSLLDSSGVDRERWHLNAGSRDIYDLPGLDGAEEQRA